MTTLITIHHHPIACSEYCAGEEVHSTVVSLPPTYGVQELCESSSPSAAASTDYMNKIRKRLNENASARVEREKRRRKVLVQQLTAHHAIEVGRLLCVVFCDGSVLV